jgi:hypothetical protein
MDPVAWLALLVQLSSLDGGQSDVLRKVDAALCEEYKVRRRMLIERAKVRCRAHLLVLWAQKGPVRWCLRCCSSKAVADLLLQLRPGCLEPLQRLSSCMSASQMWCEMSTMALCVAGPATTVKLFHPCDACSKPARADSASITQIITNQPA